MSQTTNHLSTSKTINNADRQRTGLPALKTTHTMTKHNGNTSNNHNNNCNNSTRKEQEQHKTTGNDRYSLETTETKQRYHPFKHSPFQAAPRPSLVFHSLSSFFLHPKQHDRNHYATNQTRNPFCECQCCCALLVFLWLFCFWVLFEREKPRLQTKNKNGLQQIKAITTKAATTANSTRIINKQQYKKTKIHILSVTI